jgi:hypothetical protein
MVPLWTGIAITKRVTGRDDGAGRSGAKGRYCQNKPAADC